MTVTNIELLSIAIHRIGRGIDPVDIEDLAIKAFELAPERFCWRNHTEMIDLRTVHNALTDEKKAESALIAGDSRRGYRLTSAGAEYCIEKTEPSLDTARMGAGRRSTNSSKKRKEQARLRATQSYQKIQNEKIGELNRRDFEEFFRVDEYFTIEMRQNRMRKVALAAAGDRRLEMVVRALAELFEKGSSKL